MKTVLEIEGMHCGGCTAAVRNALSAVTPVAGVSVDLERGLATIETMGAADTAALIAAVEEAGYQAAVRPEAQRP